MDWSPRIEIVMGPMYSGKTSELMRRTRRFAHAKRKCLVIKYARDDRYSEECVASHDRQLMQAVPAVKLAEVAATALAADVDVVAIDEGQFFTDIVEYAEAFANAGKVVIISALDGDFRRKPFGRVWELIPMAERVDKLTAVCTSCGKDAAFTKRTVASTEIELIGGAESYAPVCRGCFVASGRPTTPAAAAAAPAAEAAQEEAAAPVTPAAKTTSVTPITGTVGGSPVVPPMAPLA